jgi:hypothetical protein
MTTTSGPDRLVALVDLDGTLCDCAGALEREMSELRGPNEGGEDESRWDPPRFIEARRRLVMAVPGFWRNLAPLASGFELLDLLRGVGFDIHILTKGPADNSLAWMEKFEWCRRHVPDLPIVITENKELVSGAVLVEDWPPYIDTWIGAFPSGLVIIPHQRWNIGVEARHPKNAVRYDGAGTESLRRRLEKMMTAAEA